MNETQQFFLALTFIFPHFSDAVVGDVFTKGRSVINSTHLI